MDIFINQIQELVVTFVQQQTFFASILFLIIEEAGVPTPISGSLIVAYTGYKFSQNDMPPYPVLFVSLLAAMLIGSSILYYLSYRWGQIIVLKFGRFVHLNEKKLIYFEETFNKYGPWFIIFGRHLPGFRIPITIFSGMSRIKYSTFIVCTFISVVFWIPIYLFLGMRLGPQTVHMLRSHNIFLIAAPLVIFVLSIYITVLTSKHIDRHINKRKRK